MSTAVICTALLGLLVFLLGLNVSRVRASTKRGGGFSGDSADPLTIAVRAHANTTEFAPMLAVLMLYLGTTAPAAWVVWVMALTTACRFALVAGLFLSPTLEKTHPLRFIGASGTYFGGTLLAVAALLTVL
jgi:hypothetical protein